tara:strand:+ start:3083 stop:3823 length:741 start_codon:yes stop_codon:yes gene_type:complete
MKKKKSELYVFYCLLVIHFSSFSQILSIDHTDLKKNGLSGFTELDFDYNKSTQVDWEFINNTYINYAALKYSLIFMNKIDINKAASSEISNNGYQHVRFLYNLKKNFFIESFIQNQYDLIQDVKNRKIIGLGFKRTILNLNYIGMSIFYEYELLIDDILNKCYRFNLYNQLYFKIFNNLTSSSFLYIQPSLINFSDLRLTFKSTFSVPLFKQFFFNLTILFTHDSSPAFNIPKTNYHILNGLKFKF